MSDKAKTWVTTELMGTRPVLLGVMIALADLADKSGVVYADIEEIADRAEVGTATVKRSIAHLSKIGTITRQRHYEDGARQPDITIIAPVAQGQRRPMLSPPKDLRPEE
jgi:DNA-binding MarR family transcriptional regulator